MSKEIMLTTIDNPFDPFEQFTSWLLFDKEKGYDTCERLMRLAKVNDDMSSAEYDAAVEQAMNTLIENDILNVFKKVTKEDKNEDNSEQNEQNVDENAQ